MLEYLTTVAKSRIQDRKTRKTSNKTNRKNNDGRQCSLGRRRIKGGRAVGRKSSEITCAREKLVKRQIESEFERRGGAAWVDGE